ncbi:MAG: lysophospholipid acyltransferase family protein [Ectothiorhodospiraceae bacterium]|jgi:1-acyl-sn-glycerol-3-phosphate acyltransferase
MLFLGRCIRLLLGWVDLALMSAMLWALAWLPRRWTRGWYPRLFWGWCRVFVKALDVELRVHQRYARPLPSRYLLIANHPSALEDIAIPALFDVYSLAKIEVRDWWVVGRISEAAGTLYVHRESRESRNEAADAIEAAVREGRNVALYPEGGCKGRRIAPEFKYGVFDISLRTGIPVVPVFIHYEAQETFEWKPHETLLDKIRHFITAPNRHANYHVFDAFHPENYDTVPAYCDAVYSQYLEWQRRFLE